MGQNVGQKPIGAYATETGAGTGFAAYDKHGHTWSVEADEAAKLKSDRTTRIANCQTAKSNTKNLK